MEHSMLSVTLNVHSMGHAGLCIHSVIPRNTSRPWSEEQVPEAKEVAQEVKSEQSQFQAGSMTKPGRVRALVAPILTYFVSVLDTLPSPESSVRSLWKRP